jgi:cyclic beta-1,2-glucan synthetase
MLAPDLLREGHSPALAVRAGGAGKPGPPWEALQETTAMTTATTLAPSTATAGGDVPPCTPYLDWQGDRPIRAELCSPVQFHELARSLAAAAQVGRPTVGQPLLRRLDRNAHVLRLAHKHLAAGVARQEPLTTDAEWLLDNFHIVEEVLREVRTDLPQGYYAELPALSGGPLAGLPRIYALALAVVAHTDSSIDEDQVLAFVRAYQEVTPLTIGELWAIPTMLRLALVENLRRLAAQMLEARTDRVLAARWAAASAGRPQPLPPAPRDAFLVALLQSLRDHAPAGAHAEDVHAWLTGHGADITEALRREHRRQAANQVSIGNCVTSLRLLSVLDWSDFFEKASLVEEVLRGEPTGVYARQDFATRDRYRRAVEQLARGGRRAEVEVARRAVSRAAAAQREGPALPAAHLGWHLIGDGRSAFEADLGYRPRFRDWVKDFLLGHPSLVFFGLLGLLTVGLTAGVLAVAAPASWGMAALIAAVAVLPGSEVAVTLTNYLVAKLVPPRVLPRLELRGGIPADCATFVVIPGMLARPDSAAHLVERLELHYLANPDPQLRFALLTDFADAPKPDMPEDERYVKAALAGIAELNRRHAPEGAPRFFLFHRKRQWDAAEGCWMGWERKRGKLHEFNRLLRGARDTSYTVVSGEVDDPLSVRYVLTLDADTVLPREAARRLISILAHPLNRAVLSDDGRRVERGYAILQPRVSFLYQTGLRSWFARIYAGSAGIDPYSSACSDTYMDLFGRGTFTGKGLYDVDAFEATAGHAFPDNSILSHDLIESNFARCALVTNVEVFDEFPSKYHAYARREHRWARGDWQLLPWLLPTVPTPQGRQRNALPSLERWKVLDNMRRTLVPVALVLLLVLGWTVLPGHAWAWTLTALAAPLIPLLLQVIGRTGDLLDGVPRRALLALAPYSIGSTAGQAALEIAFLPNQARLLLDAIARTLWRVVVSRRHMLEWETSAATEARLGTGVGQFAQTMWPASLLAVLFTGLVGWAAPASLAAAAPVLLVWVLAPLLAFVVSRPRRLAEEPLTLAEEAVLRQVARRTWAFFETFVGPDDHWLPPDNYQEDPKGEIAHRTSPTNKGMLLLSTLAAHDLGYLSLPALAYRLGNTLDTLDRLDRYKGHFYNWYDTRTLKPLPPGYVSTVDSGNLLACLLTLEHGLLEKVETPVPAPAAARGLLDSIGLVVEEGQRARARAGRHSNDWSRVSAQLTELQRLAATSAADLAQWSALLGTLDQKCAALAESVRLVDAAPKPAPTPGTIHLPTLSDWAARLSQQVRLLREEVTDLAPWLDGLPAADAAGKGWPGLRRKLVAISSLKQWEKALPELLAELDQPSELPEETAERLRAALRRSQAGAWAEGLHRLAAHADRLASGMDFRFLYNFERHLFSIGFNTLTGRLDQGHYDLLASEACLSSFLAIARGEVPRRHWFQLGRLTTRQADRPGLLSWGGTMFEYLMPRLLLPIPRGTLLDATERTAVARQIEYGRQIGLPWGISESAYYAFGPTQDYQYQSFGVPGLGLKRGLAQDRVIAPYATLLAVPLQPREALANIGRLRAEGVEGALGFYEAIDYTPSHLPDGMRSGLVRCWMAHHQGMALVALTNRLTGDIMPRRFQREPAVRAADLLLEERVPHDAPLLLAETAEEAESAAAPAAYPVSRRLTSPDTPGPRTHLLSNGRYAVMLTNSGAGFSKRIDGPGPDGKRFEIDVTRWRADRTADDWGQFIYIRDRRSGNTWSAGYQPTLRKPDSYEVVYSLDKAELRRVDTLTPSQRTGASGRIETLMEVAVSPDRDVEVRRVTLRNLGSEPRELELTSYVEVVLLPHAADTMHPAFGKLFLQTEWLPGAKALLCQRRTREEHQQPVCAVHVVTGDGAENETEHETDRLRFLGRRNTVADPVGLDGPLSGTVGPVLDPVLVLRRRVRVEPGDTATVAFVTGVVDTREEAVTLADSYQNLHAVTRSFELAWAHSRLQLRHHGLEMEQAHLYQRLAGHILYPGPALRAPTAVIKANRLGQPALWRHGISGDLPIVLVRIAGDGEIVLWRDAVRAHSYLWAAGLVFDLVALVEEMDGYHESLYQTVLGVLRNSDTRHLEDRPGGVFVRKASHLPEEDRMLLQAAARVVLLGDHGPLGTQIDVRERGPALPQRIFGPLVERQRPRRARAAADAGGAGLQFFNGVGGFSADGREYVLAAGAVPPAPWVNVVSNPECGFIVSDSGGGCTWVGNSQSNRLTPWSNDPVCDPAREVVYLRDEATGEVWTPTPLPAGEGAPTRVRHGAGYSVFEQKHDGIEQELTLFVPRKGTVKLLLLRVKNTSGKARRLTATYYAEWVLGGNRGQTALHIITEEDPASGAVLARNPFNADSGPAVAFAAVSACGTCNFTADRAEFRGRNRPAWAPAGLEQVRLSGRTGPGLDPCAAIQAPLELAAGAEKELVFLLGEAADVAQARELVQRYREPAAAREALCDVVQGWDSLLGAVQVQTPDEGMNLLLNRWLLYQTTSCRLWGRSALYQSGGAYGFRDQLQDVMALVYAAPELAHEQLLRAAQHQFEEGDVMHWWHPPELFLGEGGPGRGVRTRISDDFLWLPFVACHYARVTGDAKVFDERAPFLHAAPLAPGEEERYGVASFGEAGTLYEHCCRALDNGWKLGAHGLPLMGTGDWNDGMNKVGAGGKGESVWVAWFQADILGHFAEVAEVRRDEKRARTCRERRAALLAALEEHGWDGQWYLRAFFDDGSPLGSHTNEDCQIDSLPQSWAVLSGGARRDRAAQAVESARERLVRQGDRLILLFDPPFDAGPQHPGYIKGYVPGIRENGGQYTHAATWLVRAVAALGQATAAHALFDLLDPITRTADASGVERYHIEPYVLAGDVYGRPPHTGRGGWSWYTGAAAWLYRVGLETLLGFHKQGDVLRIEPRIPASWREAEITYRHGSATYRIVIENPDGVESGAVRVEADGKEVEGCAVPLRDDGGTHEVHVHLVRR